MAPVSHRISFAAAGPNTPSPIRPRRLRLRQTASVQVLLQASSRGRRDPARSKLVSRRDPGGGSRPAFADRHRARRRSRPRSRPTSVEALPGRPGDGATWLKLIPGVQYSEDAVRGLRSAAGQDNVYQFDGVNVNPAAFRHPLGRAFLARHQRNRGGRRRRQRGRFQPRGRLLDQLGLEIGTNEYKATNSVPGPEPQHDRRPPPPAPRSSTKTRTAGGQLRRPDRHRLLDFERLRLPPDADRANRENLYGPVPDLASDRDEFFGKLYLLAHRRPAAARQLPHLGPHRDRLQRLEQPFAGLTSVGNEATSTSASSKATG